MLGRRLWTTPNRYGANKSLQGILAITADVWFFLGCILCDIQLDI